MTATDLEKGVYWVLFWDLTSLTLTAENLEDVGHELQRRNEPMHQVFAVVRV